MANGIKFEPAESGSLRIGNANIASQQQSVTNPSSYWTSIEPVNGGYTVYIDKANNGPSIYNANSDSELIVLGNKLSGQTFANINDCLAWFNTYEPGNRNYLRNYPYWQRLGGFIYDSLDDSINIYNVPNYYNHSESNVINLVDNILYTLTIDAPIVSGSCVLEIQSRPDGVGYNKILTQYLVHGTNTFTFNSGFLPVGFTHYTLRFFGINTTNPITVKIRKIKLEKGSTATAWRAAMEDPEYVPDKFVLSSEIPPIVTNGLVLNYDAGLIPSYPRGGTVINDVSGNGNNGTLVNGVGYSSEGGGSFFFDDTNDHINATNVNLSTITNGTICFWGKNIGNSEWLFMTGDNTSYYIFATYAGVNFYNANCGSPTYYVDGIQTSVSPTDTNWHHMVATNVNLSTWNTFIIGEYSGTSFKYNGYINDIKFYNRALTSSEILQNYYAGLQKFIPKDGLVLSLSPQNSIFSGTTPITVRDISGNANDGTINNGVTYVRDGGGSWSFDGVDDSINLGNVLNVSTGDYSMVIWVKINGSSTAFMSLFSKKGIAAANAGYAIYYNGSTKKLMWSNGNGSIYEEYYTNNTIPLDTWINVVCIRSVSSNPKGYFYINNILYPITTNPTGINVSNSYDFTIGKNSNSSLFYDGNIGQVMLYNRALTATEISTIYQATKSKYV